MHNEAPFGDELGPAKVVQIYEPSAGLKASLIIDNVAAGPSIGGVRMAPDVTLDECYRLARAMTFKNAAAGLPHGGGKAVLCGDPKMPKRDKEHLIRALACALKSLEEYIPGPDMGTNEECMAWIKDEINRAVGLPRELGSIPLNDIGATGWGLRHAAEVAAARCGFSLDGTRVVVEGFGSVGRHAARFLAAEGTVLVAAADSRGAVHDPDGLDVDALIVLKEEGRSVADYANGTRSPPDGLIDVECEIWIPAARPDVIREDNVHRLKAKIVLPGANIAVTAGAEAILHQRGVLCMPDFIVNAGGVICAAMEYAGTTEAAAFQAIEEKLRRNTEAVLDMSVEQRVTPREAAVRLASERVRQAMNCRRWSIF
jgi:glutamate dehydrogenase (NAD(P)+)